MKKPKYKGFGPWTSLKILCIRFGLEVATLRTILAQKKLKPYSSKKPTKFAMKQGLSKKVLKENKTFYLWHIDKITNLISTTHPIVDDAEFERALSKWRKMVANDPKAVHWLEAD